VASTTESNRERNKRRGAREFERAPRRPGESAASHWVRTGIRGGLLRFGKRIRPALNDFLGRHSKIGTPAYFDNELFDWVPGLEARHEAIRKEAEMVMTARDRLWPLHELSPHHGRIDAEDDKWKVFFLKGYGFWVDEHCRQCPETYRAVKDIPGLESAFFSILEASKRIRKHRGPTRSIFTAHLPLLLPIDRENCWIRVNKVKRHWETGRMLIFDDTYKHRVSNDTQEDRVVLLMHIRRPVKFPASLVRDAIFGAIRWSPFVQDSRRKQRERERPLARVAGPAG
jgi:beta-hydroxylase